MGINIIKKVTIGIITYKRPIGLKTLLLSLKTQFLVNINLSIIVVDNDAIGTNQEVIDAIKSDYPFQLELFVEKKRGIVAARNRVVSEFLKSNSESLIFIDDDEQPVENDWIFKLLEAQEDFQADIVYSDVNIIPETDDILWVKDAYQINNNEKNVVPTKKFYTNNLLVSRHVYEELNPPFDERFAISGSEDLHFSIRANKYKFKAYYTPSAPVEEIFPLSRATLKWFFLRGFRIGEGSTRANIYEGNFITYGYVLYMFAGRFVRGMQILLHSVLVLNKSYFTKGFTYIGAAIGTIAGLFGLKYDEYRSTHGK